MLILWDENRVDVLEVLKGGGQSLFFQQGKAGWISNTYGPNDLEKENFFGVNKITFLLLL